MLMGAPGRLMGALGMSFDGNRIIGTKKARLNYLSSGGEADGCPEAGAMDSPEVGPVRPRREAAAAHAALQVGRPNDSRSQDCGTLPGECGRFPQERDRARSPS